MKDTFFIRSLNWIEKHGNDLPHPLVLFFQFFCITVVLSALLDFFGVSATYSVAQSGELVEKTVAVRNMLTKQGIRDIFTSGVHNFISQPALGSVVVAILGVGIAEGSGLMNAAIKRVVMGTPKSLISLFVVFTGVMSNVASDAGYVVLVPLGGVIFASFGRHPLAGIAAAFAGVSGGFSANLLIGTIDPLLSGITTSAAHILLPEYTVLPTANYFFMMASTFLITILGAFVTDNIVEPRLGAYHNAQDLAAQSNDLTDDEKRGLSYATISFLFFLAVLLLLVVPENAILKLNADEIASFVQKNGRQPGSLELLKPFISDSIVMVLMLFFLIPGYAYGLGAKTIHDPKDVARFMNQSIASISSVIVLLFVSAQFIYVFNQSNIGVILAVYLAEFLQNIGVGGIAVTIGLILISAFVNLFLGSASAKWLVLSPIFVPLFIQLGISPELAQVAYRIGDSTTNIISPLMTYFPVILTFMLKYSEEKDNVGIGSIVALMLPYSIVFLFAWIVFFIIWLSLGIPVGPGVQNFF